MTPVLPAHLNVLWRFVWTSIAFIPLLLLLKIPFKVPRALWGGLTAASLMMGLYQWAFFKGLSTGLAGGGAVLVTTLNPIVTFFMASLIERKKPTRNETIGLLLGGASLIFFLHLWTFDLELFMGKGTLYFLFASLCWSIMTVIGSKLNLNPILMTFYVYLIVTPILVFQFGNALADYHTLPPSYWFHMALLVLLGTLFSTSAYFLGAQALGARRGASFIFIVPVAAAIFATLILKESLPFSTCIGGLLSLAGVYKINKA